MLPRLIGRARATEMMMLGERVPAAKALDWGMIHRVVADDALDAEAFALAERLAAGPTVALGLMQPRAQPCARERLRRRDAARGREPARGARHGGFDGGRDGVPPEAQAGVQGRMMRFVIPVPAKAGASVSARAVQRSDSHRLQTGARPSPGRNDR